MALNISQQDATGQWNVTYLTNQEASRVEVMSSRRRMVWTLGPAEQRFPFKPAIPTTVNAGAVLASWSILYGLVLDLAGRSFKGDFWERHEKLAVRGHAAFDQLMTSWETVVDAWLSSPGAHFKISENISFASATHCSRTVTHHIEPPGDESDLTRNVLAVSLRENYSGKQPNAGNSPENHYNL